MISIKKILIIFLVIVLISLFFVKTEKTEFASASAELPQKQTIIIDAGHGGFDGGAVANDGTLEKDINLSVAKCLKDMLKLSGFNVIMIRETDSGVESDRNDTIAKRKVSDMKKRLEILNSNDDAIFVSIHQNKFTSSSVSGAQVFYSDNVIESKAVAEFIQTSFSKRLQQDNNRMVKKGNKNIYLLYNAKIPAVIVECGFLSNPDELAKLKTEDYRKKCAFTVCCGILDYFSKVAT